MCLPLPNKKTIKHQDLNWIKQTSMTQLRTSCKWKFWLNKTTTCFEFASCVSRVIALDKETASNTEKRGQSSRRKKKTHAQKTTEPPQSQWFKCCLVCWPRNKLIPMLNAFPLFSRGFSNAECIKQSYHLRSSEKSYDFSFLLCVLGQRSVLSYFRIKRKQKP